MPLAVIIPANFARRYDIALVLTYVLLAAACATTAVIGLGNIVASSQVHLGTAQIAVGAVSAVPLLRPVRAAIGRMLPIRAEGSLGFDPDSPVHMTALCLSVLYFGSALAAQLTTDVLGQQAQSGVPLTPIDLIAQEIPFLILAAAGVGLAMRRDLRPALGRLGFVRPRVWHVALALSAAGIFYLVGIGLDQLGQMWTPATANRVNAATQRLFGGLDTLPGIATVALAAGICEEGLFRGALQPRLGIVWTSLVFASAHSQYGISFDVLSVFILACGLGLIRRYTNTTASALCHVAYNAVVGFEIAARIPVWGMAAEGVVLLFLALSVLLALRRPDPSSQPL